MELAVHKLTQTKRIKYNKNINFDIFPRINFELTSIKQTTFNK